MKRLLFLALALMCGSAQALEITGAADGPGPGKRDYSLSGSLLLCGVSVGPGLGGIPVVRLPVESRGGPDWRNLRILDKSFHDRLCAAQSGPNFRSGGKASHPSLGLGGVHLLNSNFRIANVEIVFDGQLLAVFGVVRRKVRGLDSYSVDAPGFLSVRDEALRDEIRVLAVEAAKKALARRVGAAEAA